MKAKVTDEMFASIPELLAQGMDRKQIAEQFGTSWQSLQVMCCKRRIPLRNPKRPRLAKLALTPHQPLPLGHKKIRELHDEAEKRGMDEVQLVTKLLNIIVKDDLFKAVLDVKEVA